MRTVIQRVKYAKVSVDGKVLKETTYEDAARNGTDRISTTSLTA